MPNARSPFDEATENDGAAALPENPPDLHAVRLIQNVARAPHGAGATIVSRVQRGRRARSAPLTSRRVATSLPLVRFIAGGATAAQTSTGGGALTVVGY